MGALRGIDPPDIGDVKARCLRVSGQVGEWKVDDALRREQVDILLEVAEWIPGRLPFRDLKRDIQLVIERFVRPGPAEAIIARLADRAVHRKQGEFRLEWARPAQFVQPAPPSRRLGGRSACRYEQPEDVPADAATPAVGRLVLAGEVATLLGGNYVNRFNYFDRSYKVIPQIERAARLTPDQRRQALQALSQVVPPSEINGDDPASLARTATRAELRQPGTIERVWGGGGPGLGTWFLSTLAASFIGTAIAQSFFANDLAGDQGTGEQGADQGADQAGDQSSDTGQGDTADYGGEYAGDPGDSGDFGGGDFGGGDFGGI